MEIQNQPPDKPSFFSRFIFGVGSACFLGLTIGGLISGKFIKPDSDNSNWGLGLIGLFFVLFFLTGFYKSGFLSSLFQNYFASQGKLPSEKDLQSKVSAGWALYFILLSIICFLLIFTSVGELVPIIFIVGFIILGIGVKVKKVD